MKTESTTPVEPLTQPACEVVRLRIQSTSDVLDVSIATELLSLCIAMQPLSMYAAFFAELRDFLVDAGIATASTIRGCTDSEIADLERRLSVRLPAAMVECLRHMGHECGHFLDGDEFGLLAFDDAAQVAREITTEPNSPWRLPDEAIPFLQHHGHEFLFVYSNAEDDPMVWLYIETKPKPIQWGSSFTAWLRESAIEAIECKPWNDEVCREIRLHRDDWMARKKTLDAYGNEAKQIRQCLTARLIQSDHERGRITGPTEIQQIWNREFPGSDLHRRLKAEEKRIPWGWVNPSDA